MVLIHSVATDGSHIFHNTQSKKYLFLNGNSGASVSDVLPAIYSKLSVGPATTISCIIGTIKLKINRYVIVADSHTITGSILGNQIAKIESFRILPLVSNQFSQKNAEESTYLDLLNQHLSSATLYYSIDNKYDLTNSLQRQFTTENVSLDNRFWWNSYLSEEFIENGAQDFVTPIIYGYFKSHSASFNGPHPLDFALLTRRSTFRAGTRYFRRGVDSDGNVANFNETEQIFTNKDNQIFSLLQTRGSVPVYWAEINNLKYKPNLVISSRSALDATEKHFAEQVELYGDNYLVNLVNQKGHELPVKQSYEHAVENLPPALASRVNYIYFDFHHECRNMRWDRIKLLLEHLIQLNYTSDNYFHYDLNSRAIISKQTKIVRTNCMDCLDRTNVVQSMIARWVFQNQLTKANYLSKENVTPWEILDPSFNLFFQDFWADNADAVSCAYSGTGALKTDFTRTGKRTKQGALSDLQNSITRYYKNNYKDGSRQDSYDLFLGKFKPYQDSVESPFIDKRPPYLQLLPYLMGTSFLVLIAILLFPRGPITEWKNILVISGCLIYNIRSLLYLNKNGYQFVNWPRLVNLDFLRKIEIPGSSGVKYVEQDTFTTTVGKKKK
ncbi:SacI homology domain-containing protein [Scheffersomyces xylosifermentans]|uniref:SacI homology domain-containing protein n=1 Tax=Scheffersomyces xylosifermentans TaxID=1304137 RepID=UPI00315DBA7B